MLNECVFEKEQNVLLSLTELDLESLPGGTGEAIGQRPPPCLPLGALGKSLKPL